MPMKDKTGVRTWFEKKSTAAMENIFLSFSCNIPFRSIMYGNLEAC